MFGWRQYGGYLTKLLGLGLVDGLGLWAAAVLYADRSWGLLAALLAGLVALNLVFGLECLYPARYLLPGLIFLAAMVIYPIGYTVVVSTTNYGVGHILSRQQAIDQITSRYEPVAGGRTYPFTAYRDPSGALAVLLDARAAGARAGAGAAAGAAAGAGDAGGSGEASQAYDAPAWLWGAVAAAADGSAGSAGAAGSAATSGGGAQPGGAGDLEPLAAGDPRLVDENGDGTPERVGEFQLLSRREMLQLASRLQNLVFEYGDTRLRMRSISQFAEVAPRYRYDAAQDAMIDQVRGTVYRAQKGTFVSETGEALTPGFRAPVGWENYLRLINNPQIAEPFFRVLVWTFEWAALSVLTTFALGLLLAVLLNDPFLQLRSLYRTLLIVPYALPAFISALVWRGMYNTELGVINRWLGAAFGISIPWLQDPFWAKVALVILNLWLGFPYMMVVTLGALQSIPGDLYEAATVDGASPWQQFWRITFPLLLIAVAPLLVASFAFNFNNFVVIYLLTEGRPPIPGAQTPAGATDILISYTYRLAFESGQGADYGLASAIAILIFLFIGTISYFNFKFTRALEEVRTNV